MKYSPVLLPATWIEWNWDTNGSQLLDKNMSSPPTSLWERPPPTTLRSPSTLPSRTQLTQMTTDAWGNGRTQLFKSTSTPYIDSSTMTSGESFTTTSRKSPTPPGSCFSTASKSASSIKEYTLLRTPSQLSERFSSSATLCGWLHLHH